MCKQGSIYKHNFLSSLTKLYISSLTDFSPLLEDGETRTDISGHLQNDLANVHKEKKVLKSCENMATELTSLYLTQTWNYSIYQKKKKKSGNPYEKSLGKDKTYHF